MPLCVKCQTAEAEFHTPDKRAVCSAICASRLLGVPRERVSVETVNALFSGHGRSELDIGVNLEDQITAAERAVKTLQDRLSQTEDSERDAWTKLQSKKEQRDQEYAIHVKPLDDQVDAMRSLWSDFTKNKSALQREVYSAESKAQKLREQLKSRPGSAKAAAAAGVVKPSPPLATMTVDPVPSTTTTIMPVDPKPPKEDKSSSSASGGGDDDDSSSSQSSDFGSDDERHESRWFKSKHRKILPALYRQKDGLLQALASEVINMIEQKSARAHDPNVYRDQFGAFVYTINLYWAIVTDAPQSDIAEPTFSRENALTYLFNPLSYDDSPAAPHRTYHSQQMIQSLVDSEATDLFQLFIQPVVTFRQDAYRQLPFKQVVKQLYDDLKARFTSKEKILKVMNDVLFMVVACYLTENTTNEEVVELVVRKHKLSVPKIDDDESGQQDEDDDDDSSSSSAADSFKTRRNFYESEQSHIVTMLAKSSRNVFWRVAQLATRQMILDSARTDEKVKKRGAVLAQAMLYLSQLRDNESNGEYYPPANFQPQDARTELFNPLDSDLDQATEGSYAEAVEETINSAEYAHTASDFFHHSFANLMTFEGGLPKTKEFRALVVRTKLSVDVNDFDRAVDGSAFMVTAFYLSSLKNDRLPTIKSTLLQERSAAAAAASSQ